MTFRTRRAALTVAGTVITAGAAAGAVAAASADTPSGSPKAPSASASGQPRPPAAPGHRPAAPGHRPAAPGHRPAALGANDADGLLSKVSASSLTLTTVLGKSSTYVRTSSTTVHAGPNGSATLRVGEHVVVRGTRTSGTLRAVSVDVRAAHIGGGVVGVSGNTMTVRDLDGFTHVVSISSSAKITHNGKTATLSAITVGRWIDADGQAAGDGVTLQATHVTVRDSVPLPRAGGPAAGPAGQPAGPPAGKAPQPKPKR
ncbi:DUF5666 domain-containing protein [uncultured Jatrophihabitans sp.]|uniref:DUF5666 domain-containing protein n=1 Tax=uncultured Jatrophihabitans sp. TaxID=1610747 RepID=UPI0035CC47AC